MINHHQKPSDKGQLLVALIITVPFLILMVASYLSLSVSGFRLARQDQMHTQAQLSADAGADYGIEQLNQDGTWAGTGSEITLHNDADVRTTYAVSVADNGADSKTLTSIGKSYRPASSSSPTATVTIQVNLRPVTSGNYSVVSGEGGLTMSNSAKIVGGDVLINGEVNLSNSAQIGLTTNPVNVSVANQACPVPPADMSTYPRLCNSGENDNPISIQNTAHIYGTVKANYQSNSSGMSDPGLTASSGVAAQALPTYDRNGQKAAVSNTISGNFSCSSGSQIWPANTHITGDASVSNKCKVTVQGNVWISGKLTVSNQAQLIVADSLGSTVPVIMVDGRDGAKFSNAAELLSNSSSTGFEVITFWSEASCSPDCSSVTGSDLYNSRNDTTIELSNSAEGPQTVFYSRWTKVSVSNSGQIGALIGETVAMNNTATITFGSTAGGLGQTFWVVNGYRHTF